MTLLNQLTNLSKQYLKSGDKEKLKASRWLLNLVQTETKKLLRDLNPTEESVLLQKEIKQREECLVLYETRPDLVLAEQEIISMAQSYLPKQLTVNEVRSIIHTAFTTGAGVNLGSLMKTCVPLVAGKYSSKDLRVAIEQYLNGDDL